MLKLIEDKPEVPANIKVSRDLVYKVTQEKTLKLDIYHLDSLDGERPLLVFIHGGSWKKGNKDDYRRYLVDYAQKGYVTATVAYRFSQEATFPAAFDDVVCAIKWLKSRAADYHIDPERVAVIGGSAGGHLAMMVGYHARDENYQGECATDETDAGVKAIVNLYGPVDLTTDFAINHPSVQQLIGMEYSGETKSAYKACSPITFITPDDPPTLTFHGTIDDIVPIVQADMLDEALRKENIASYYHRLDGWPHTMDLSLKINNYCQYYMDEFFQKHLE
ncbi:carboxylesterase [Flavilitoribacter nigricans DSM 23189 = NBRC 102662]|uniref:Carboxylesterase n=2 Tax=Flavilitoribacter TaxID=2762562 RepID=A0A2D0NDN7_FLAN2|nr:carboxylesterase [Flavilitoribacter nigricans DSM 23189 = NBRC 102662]